MLVVVTTIERLSHDKQQDQLKVIFTDLKKRQKAIDYQENYLEASCFIYHPIIKKYLKYRKEGTLFMIKEPTILPYKHGLPPAFKITRIANLIPVSIVKDFGFCQNIYRGKRCTNFVNLQLEKICSKHRREIEAEQMVQLTRQKQAQRQNQLQSFLEMQRKTKVRQNSFKRKAQEWKNQKLQNFAPPQISFDRKAHIDFEGRKQKSTQPQIVEEKKPSRHIQDRIKKMFERKGNPNQQTLLERPREMLKKAQKEDTSGLERPNTALISLMKDLKQAQIKPELKRTMTDGKRPVFYSRKEVEEKKTAELNQRIKQKNEEISIEVGGKGSISREFIKKMFSKEDCEPAY